MKAHVEILIFLLIVSLAPLACTSQQEKTSGPATSSESYDKSPVREAPTAQKPGHADLPPVTGQLSYQDRQAWRKIINWSNDCEEAFDSTMSKEDAGLEFYELGEGAYLVEVTCTLGAYQGFQNYSHLTLSGAQPVARTLTFPTYESEDEGKLEKKETEELWGFPEFDLKRKRLTIFNKFRGLGDCGALATYSFQDGAPKLVEVRAKLKCDGQGAEDPKQWKTITPP